MMSPCSVGLCPKFALGEISRTASLNSYPELKLLLCLARHAAGDWGDLDPDDKARNDAALRDGGRVMSVYAMRDHESVWIFTEGDAHCRRTTMMQPHEY